MRSARTCVTTAERHALALQSVQTRAIRRRIARFNKSVPRLCATSNLDHYLYRPRSKTTILRLSRKTAQVAAQAACELGVQSEEIVLIVQFNR